MLWRHGIVSWQSWKIQQSIDNGEPDQADVRVHQNEREHQGHGQGDNNPSALHSEMPERLNGWREHW